MEEAHGATRDQGPDHKDHERRDHDLGPVFLQEGLRGLVGHQVDEAAEVPDHANVQDRVADRKKGGDREDAFERADIVLQEGPEPGGRGVLFSIGLIGIDEVFEEAEHGGRP